MNNNIGIISKGDKVFGTPNTSTNVNHIKEDGTETTVSRELIDLNDNLTSLLIVEDITLGTTTVPSQGVQQFRFTKPQKSGYEIGAITVITGGSAISSGIADMSDFPDINDWYISLTSNYGSALTFTLKIRVLWVKSLN